MPPITVTSINPPIGHTGGRNLIEIIGTGFRVPQRTQHASFAPSAPARQTVRVLIDDVPALRVEVANETTVRVFTPPHAPDRWAYQDDITSELSPAPNGNAIPPDGMTLVQTHFGTVPIVIENIDATGTAYPGESLTINNAFTYKRARLDMLGTWHRVRNAFIDMLRDQVCENVAPFASIDYDTNTGAPLGFLDLVGLPAIAITGVSYPFSDTESQASVGIDERENNYTLIRRPPIMNDFSCVLVVVSDNLDEVDAIGQTLCMVLNRSGNLTYPNVIGDPTAGVSRFRYVVDRAGFQISGRIGNTNNLTGTLAVTVKSIPTDYIPGTPDAGMATTTSWQPHDGVIGVTRRLLSTSVGAINKRLQTR